MLHNESPSALDRIVTSLKVIALVTVLGTVVLAAQPDLYGPGWWQVAVVGVDGDDLTLELSPHLSLLDGSCPSPRRARSPSRFAFAMSGDREKFSPAVATTTCQSLSRSRTFSESSRTIPAAGVNRGRVNGNR